jgi:hypothetical protein
MLRSNAKAAAKQSYFGDDAPVTGITLSTRATVGCTVGAK